MKSPQVDGQSFRFPERTYRAIKLVVIIFKRKDECSNISLQPRGRDPVLLTGRCGEVAQHRNPK